MITIDRDKTEHKSKEIKGYIRDINMSLVVDNRNIKLDISQRKDRRQWLKPNWKTIKYITKIGGVLSGSRALRCYSIDGKQLLDRHSKDWDFIITRDMAFKICDHFGIKYDLSNFISIRKQVWTVHPSYSDSRRIGPIDVQLIIKDELPDYTEKRGVRIANLSYCLNSKVEMMYEIPFNIHRLDSYDFEKRKHKEDLLQIITKFNSI